MKLLPTITFSIQVNNDLTSSLTIQPEDYIIYQEEGKYELLFRGNINFSIFEDEEKQSSLILGKNALVNQQIEFNYADRRQDIDFFDQEKSR